MRFRFTRKIVEVTSIEIHTYLDGGVPRHHLLAETQEHYSSGGTVSLTMSEDYDLPFEQCLSLLDEIHHFFTLSPMGIFDFRPYETAKDYEAKTQLKTIHRDRWKRTR